MYVGSFPEPNLIRKMHGQLLSQMSTGLPNYRS